VYCRISGVVASELIGTEKAKVAAILAIFAAAARCGKDEAPGGNRRFASGGHVA
jgi:hypothetical protein